MAPPETRRRGDAQMPARLDAARADTRLGARQIRQQALAVFEKGTALVGQRDAPGGAQQQLDAQAFLERVDAPPDHRRRHPFGRRRGGEAALGRHRHERFDLF
jgi:hypothetical protein